MFRLLSTLLLSCLTVTSVFAEIVHIPADRVNTMIEYPEGDESTGGTAKRYDRREGSDSSRHPMLTVEYHLPGE